MPQISIPWKNGLIFSNHWKKVKKAGGLGAEPERCSSDFDPVTFNR